MDIHTPGKIEVVATCDKCQKASIVLELPVIPPLPSGGECETCVEAKDCPMPDMLKKHFELVVQHRTWEYEHEDPGGWHEYAIDVPDFDGTDVEWCPMHEDKDL